MTGDVVEFWTAANGDSLEVVRGSQRTIWWWRVKARNHEILFVSEPYTRKWNAKRAAKRSFPIPPDSTP